MNILHTSTNLVRLRPDRLILYLSSSLASTSCFQTIPLHTKCRIQSRAAHNQWGGLIDLQASPVSAAPGMSGPNSDGSEKPDPLAFSTGDPESEPDDDGNGVAVAAGLYPTVELQR